ncbi:MAG: DUF3999 family protein [Candidatus Omnitrophica bacterium]|nr:DUF3999 family protein [Candidatus Omnitrophota bacterium]MDD5435985.1 DUF3999 family protein [Candidatus Omnitrophota bacterium]
MRYATFFKVVTLFIFCALTAQPVLGDVMPKNWQFSKPVRIQNVSKKAVAIPLDQEIYNSAKEDLSDLRVVDQGGAECPYAIVAQSERKTDEKIPLRIIANKMTQTESVITAELNEPLKPFNSLKVIPESNNFARKITVEGSNDNKKWQVIRKGITVYSFAFQTTHTYFEKRTNEIYRGYGFGRYSEENLFMYVPESTFKFVRVTVPHDQDKEPVELKGLEIFKTVKTPAEEESFKGSIIKTEPGADPKSVDTIVDFGAVNTPLSRIEMATRESNFFRRVEIEGSNDMKTWKRAAGSVIFSISVDEEVEKNTTVDLGAAKYRYIKIITFNGDNKPVKFVSVTGYGPKKFLVIIPAAGLQYRLLYGNPAAKAADYDLGNVVRGKAVQTFDAGSLGPELRNEKYEPYKEPRPWTEDKPYILWLAMGIIIVCLLFLGFQVIKKMDAGGK